MADRWWVRRHANGWNAYVYWSADDENYSASMLPADSTLDTTVPPHVRFYERDERVARYNADRGAHEDCDDSCQPWEEMR